MSAAPGHLGRKQSPTHSTAQRAESAVAGAAFVEGDGFAEIIPDGNQVLPEAALEFGGMAESEESGARALKRNAIVVSPPADDDSFPKRALARKSGSRREESQSVSG